MPKERASLRPIGQTKAAIGCYLRHRHKELLMELWDCFVASVDKHFKYLEDEFGFRRVSQKVPFVVFESSSLRVRVYYDSPGRHELDLSIEPFEKIDRLGRPFSAGMLAQLHDPEKWRGYLSPFPNTPEKVEVEVKALADKLRLYGKDVLRGDLADLRKVARLNEELEEKLAKRRPLGRKKPSQ